MLQIKKEDGDTKDKGLVIRKSNDLINGNNRLTVSELKLFTMVLEQIKTSDKELRRFFVTAEEFGKKVGMNKNPYKFLEKISDKLQSRIIEIPTGIDGLRKKISLFQSVTYLDKKGKLAMEMHPDLEPHIINLQKRFTKYESRYIYKLKSKYVIRFYEYIKSQMGLQRKLEYIELEFSIEKIREVLDIGDKFERISSLKDRVIIKLEKEINKNTDLKINLKNIKSGKKIIGFFFTVKLKKDRRETIEEVIEAVEAVEKSVIETRLEKIGLNSKDIINELGEYQESEIIEAIKVIEEKQKRGENIASLKNYFLIVLDSKKETEYQKENREQKAATVKQQEEVKKAKEAEELKINKQSTERINKIKAEFNSYDEEQKEHLIGMVLDELAEIPFNKEIIKKDGSKEKTNLESYGKLLRTMIINGLDEVLF